MTVKAPMRDVIVMLPGILGSVLQKNGKDLWAVSGEAIWQFVSKTGDSIRNLKLSQDNSEAESLGDSIRATALIQDMETHDRSATSRTLPNSSENRAHRTSSNSGARSV